MADTSRVMSLSGLSKRGGYSGGKPASEMGPPAKLPASAAGRPLPKDSSKKS
jgi:hypothetical protein